MIRTILVPASGSDTDAAVFATALALARPLAAHLQFFNLHLSVGEAVRHAPHADFARGPAIAEVLGSVRRQGDSLSAQAFVNYHNFCHTHAVRLQDRPSTEQGMSASWLEETHDAAARLMFHARHSDAVVLGRTRNWDFLPGGLVETLLVGCGRPIIIAPPAPPRSVLGTIVVGWKETPEAARALTAALPLLERAGQVILLSIAEEGAASREALEDLSLQLRWHGISAEVRVTPATPGRATTQLQHTAVQAGADLLVIGGYGHGPLREQLFGGITRTLIDAATLPVFMLH
ncbi:MAG: universal stress protein [Steroidobacteraceae bacterium]